MILDIILILIIITYLISGISFGLIRSVGSLLGTIVGIFVANIFYSPTASYLEPLFFGNTNLSKVVCFLLIMIVVDILVTIIFYIIDRVVGWIPGLKFLNKAGGGIFGVLKGVIFMAIIIYLAKTFPWWTAFSNQLEKSYLAEYLFELIDKIIPFLPEAIGNFVSRL